MMAWRLALEHKGTSRQWMQHYCFSAHDKSYSAPLQQNTLCGTAEYSGQWIQGRFHAVDSKASFVVNRARAHHLQHGVWQILSWRSLWAPTHQVNADVDERTDMRQEGDDWLLLQCNAHSFDEVAGTFPFNLMSAMVQNPNKGYLTFFCAWSFSHSISYKLLCGHLIHLFLTYFLSI